jgi:hypothetical protein
VRSVGDTTQKNINNNTGRPNQNRTLGNLQSGRASADGVNTQNADPSSYLNRLNEIRANSVKTINTDIIHKALRDADITINQETLDIVKSLVDGSLPLTEKNIVDLLEYSRIFKGASLDTLALMIRLEIPITAENIEQFEKLTNANEKLSDKISELINKLPGEILQNSRNLSALTETLSRLLDIISNKDPGARQPVLRGNADASPPQPQGEAILTRAELNGLLNMLREIKAPDSVLNQVINANRQPVENLQDINNTSNNNINSQENSQGQTPANLQSQSQNQTQNQTQNTGAETQPQIQAQAQTQAYQTRSDAVLDIIKNFILEQSPGSLFAGAASADSPEAGANTAAPNNTDNNIANTANTANTSEEVLLFDKLKDLINSGAFQKLLKESIESRWLIDPKNFNPEKIEDFYNKLNQNLNRIENQFARLILNNQAAQEDPQAAARSAQQNPAQAAGSAGNLPEAYLDAKNIRDNLSLMNEISRTMPFMQIPVKLSNQTLNSDLYIFTNKKKKNRNGANAAGSINALLRLDLPNAGTLDVYLNLSGKNVQSRFYSQNLKSLDEIAKHLPELDEAISQMGFSFRGVASSGEKGFDFVGDFINRGVPKTEVRKYILNLKI